MRLVLDMLLASLALAGDEIVMEQISGEIAPKITIGELDELNMDISILRMKCRKLSDKLKYVGDSE